ncbi:putative acetyltransferase At3g50280 [Silene latifolia]|uniref:putative acetyltransferase At3g50280 n=1 Tax=Silene latifolia TaxID=37657 RepID=UPI003D78A3BC
MNSAKVVKHISECFIKPKYEIEESKQRFNLAPMDLPMLSFHYIQKGLLFTKPSHAKDEEFSTQEFVESLKQSLSLTLVHFFPLAGQFATNVDEERHESLVFVDCKKGPGVRFIHASLDMSISYILSPTDVPLVVQSFFDHHKAVNHDGHTRPLLSVQITELIDGIFIGCSASHAVIDGTSYWHFWNAWSEIHQANSEELSVLQPPVYERWFPEGHGPTIKLPFTNSDEFITRYEAPELRERIFHFSAESIARLKGQANEESNTQKISSFQALSALCWRSIARANRLPLEQVTNCMLVANNRHRLNPSLPQEYFGNCASAMRTSSTVSELQNNNLGWAALLVHQLVANHSHKAVLDHINSWIASPYVYQPAMFGPNSIMMGSSPRFNMYGNEFRLGKPVAVRSGYANKFVGKVTSYPGYEGGGSVDLEICLSPDSMNLLESDPEFMRAVSLPYMP